MSISNLNDLKIVLNMTFDGYWEEYDKQLTERNETLSSVGYYYVSDPDQNAIGKFLTQNEAIDYLKTDCCPKGFTVNDMYSKGWSIKYFDIRAAQKKINQLSSMLNRK